MKKFILVFALLAAASAQASDCRLASAQAGDCRLDDSSLNYIQTALKNPQAFDVKAEFNRSFYNFTNEIYNGPAHIRGADGYLIPVAARCIATLSFKDINNLTPIDAVLVDAKKPWTAVMSLDGVWDWNWGVHLTNDSPYVLAVYCQASAPDLVSNLPVSEDDLVSVLLRVMSFKITSKNVPHS